MKKKCFALLLTVVMAVSLLLCAPLPTFAASDGTPEITWLSDRPYYYNEEFGWLTFAGSSSGSTIVLATGERVEKYDHVAFFSDGLAMVAKNDANGNLKNGFIDTTGKQVIPLEYDEAGSFFDGLAGVERNGKYGFIDTTGAVVAPLEYDRVYSFSDGLARVRKDGKWCFIDTTGAVVIALQEYDADGDFSDSLARVYNKSKHGFIDTTGKLVIPMEYEEAYNFSDGLAAVRKFYSDRDNSWSFIDKTGAEVITLPQGYYAKGGFSDGLAAVGKEGGDRKYGYIDKTGAAVIPLEYDDADDFSDGLARVRKDGKWGFIDTTGAVVVPLQYDNAGIVYGGENDTVRLCWVKLGSSYGIFENPCYVRTEVPSDPEPGNTEKPGGESPAPSSPGSQDTQNPTNPGNGSSSDGGDNSNGGGFPVVPVAAATVGGVAVGAGAVVLALKKKK